MAQALPAWTLRKESPRRPRRARDPGVEGIGVRVEAWRSTKYHIGRGATQSNETQIEVSTPSILSSAGRIRWADVFDEDETTPGDN